MCPLREAVRQHRTQLGNRHSGSDHFSTIIWAAFRARYIHPPREGRDGDQLFV